jgi:DNA primase
MQGNWVDFKAVKAAVSIEAVLERYGVNWLRRKGDELRGRCPIHKGEGENTFHVSIAKGAFHCFSCKKRGNVIDFVAAIEGCTVRDAALKLKDWFVISMADPSQAAGDKKTPAPTKAGESGAAASGDLVNRPLTFELRGVDPTHPYLASRGLRRETLETFGVGFFPGKGSMSGRVVIPIHNERGELVAYAGRSIDGSELKYKLPAGFHKSLVVYNLHRVTAEEVIVVEGFFDCMKVWQSGNPSVVALMGSSLSDAQERLLVERFQRVTLLLDGDEAGQAAASEIAGRLVRRLFVRILAVPKGKQPDQLSDEELVELLKT